MVERRLRFDRLTDERSRIMELKERLDAEARQAREEAREIAGSLGEQISRMEEMLSSSVEPAFDSARSLFNTALSRANAAGREADRTNKSLVTATIQQQLASLEMARAQTFEQLSFFLGRVVEEAGSMPGASEAQSLYDDVQQKLDSAKNAAADALAGAQQNLNSAGGGDIRQTLELVASELADLERRIRGEEAPPANQGDAMPSGDESGDMPEGEMDMSGEMEGDPMMEDGSGDMPE